MSIIPQKRCSKCGVEKPLSDYNKSGSKGIRSDCKACVRAYRAGRSEHNSRVSRAYRIENNAAIRARYAQRVLPVIESKLCPQCGVIKPRNAFYPRLVSTDGLQVHCKECHTLSARTYNAGTRERHRDQIRAAAKIYRQQRKPWRYSRAKETNRAWKKVNRARLTIAQRVRTTRQQTNGGSFTLAEWEELCTKYDHRCLRCGEQKPLTIDHVIPVSLGGSSYIENIQPLCSSCNSAKKDRTMDYRR